MNKLLIGIIVLAAFLRLYVLASVPPSPSLDEASIGYNAYSILKTGSDEYGTKLPLLLRAYDDFRPALYVYLVVPFVALLNLSILAVRLPSVILSILTVLASYYIVKELFKTQKHSEYYALLTTLLLSISPWHIYISRLGHEVNAGYAFFIFGLVFLLRRKIYYAALFLGLSFISYQTEKIFIPLFLIGYGLVCWKDLLNYKKQILLSCFVGIIVLFPFIKQSFSDQGLIRFKGTNAFISQQARYDKSASAVLEAKKKNDIFGQFLNNRRMVSLEILAEGYISHFNPVWLFGNSGSEKHKVPNLGLLYIWELPFVLLGLWILFAKYSFRVKSLLCMWILSAPVAASITTDAPHALRSLVFLPTFQILCSIGLLAVFNIFKARFVQNMSIGVFVTVVIYSLSIFSKNYFFVFPATQSSSFQYALHQSMKYAISHEDKYSTIVVSNHDNLYQSYMFYLYDARYDPHLYLNQGGTKSGGYAENHSFGKFQFRPITKEDIIKKNVLIVGNKEETAMFGNPLITFSNLDGKPAIFVYENK